MNSFLIKTKMPVILGWLILVATTFSVSTSISNSHSCHESERQALLKFKQDLTDQSNCLASWSSDHDGGNCCAWCGVVCHKLSGHVLGIRLSLLGGNLSDALLNLTHLHQLDISFNDFGQSQIPEFLGSIKSLRYLRLSGDGFEGTIPHQLGNLSNLRYLDFKNGNQLHVENLQWLSRLSMLQHLDMSYVNLSKVSKNWPQVTNSLSSLKYLDLSWCELDHIPLLPKVNFSSAITHLDLSHNNFQNSSIPEWFLSLSSLTFLDLSFTKSFQGPIDGLRNMTSLRYLDLSYNFLNSSLPSWLYSFNHLEMLNLSNNNFSGIISKAIGNLTSLTVFNLKNNNFEGLASLGNLCELHFIDFSNNKIGQDISQVLLNILPRCVSNEFEYLYFSSCQIFGPIPESLELLTSLLELDVSYNQLNGTLPQSLGQLVKLRALNVGHNSFSGPIPKSLRFLTSLNWLDMSNSGIRGTIPILFWNLFSNFEHLNLSNNHFYGKLSDLPRSIFRYQPEADLVAEFDLSSNHFNGPIPHFSFNLSFLDLSNNSFSGSISHFLCDKEDSPNHLQILRLGDNKLSGELPDQCWRNWPNLISLELQNNNFSGNLPSSIGSLSKLRSLHLRNNNLSGILPSSLQSCTDLQVLDGAENKFMGSIPKWFGNQFSSLMVLSLRSNKFHGSIPDELCASELLKILDLASNSLSGNIPKCFLNYNAMVEESNSTQIIQYSPSVYSTGSGSEILERVILAMKGLMLEYSKNLRFVTIIDLSHNKLSGDIPVEITNLLTLNALNLSRNYLTGSIPQDIGKMRSLESLDLSFNLLQGKIPSTMAKMTALGVLNLSYNNLSGEIPLGPQLQTFGAFDFIGNSLCGPPLPSCTTLNQTPDPNDNDEKNYNGGVNGFYVSLIVGFVVGFWGVVAPLLYSRSWRFKYFQGLQNMWYKICDAFTYH